MNSSSKVDLVAHAGLPTEYDPKLNVKSVMWDMTCNHGVGESPACARDVVWLWRCGCGAVPVAVDVVVGLCSCVTVVVAVAVAVAVVVAVCLYLCTCVPVSMFSDALRCCVRVHSHVVERQLP